MKIYAASQLQQADQVTVQRKGISELDLMEYAGTQVFNWLHQRLQGAQVPVHIFCGIGNNGGDGLVVGRLLIQHGYEVHVYIANFTDKRSECFLENYGRIKDTGKEWPVMMTSEADFPEIGPRDIIVDALFGIGLSRPLEGWLKALVQHLNAQPAFRLAIDIPSGLYANQALYDPEAVLRAQHTLTFQAPKLSFFLPQSGDYVPYFETIDIGLDQEFLQSQEPLAQLITRTDIQQVYQQRKKYSHKGDYGHCLVIGGSYGKIGAVTMATRAAYRSGSGLVTAYVPKCGYIPVQSGVPEAMVLTAPGDEHIDRIAFDLEPTAAAIGMGMGTGADQQKALEEFLSTYSFPLVLDADALNCLSAAKDLSGLLNEQCILTPHPGELKRLIGPWEDDFQQLELARAFVEEHGCILVVKGAHTQIHTPQGLYLNTTGNPGMATGGSGDVLSGVIAGLLAQGYTALEAALAGVYLHGSAGNLATESLGFEALMAQDITAHLGAAFLALFRTQEAADKGSSEESS